VLVVGESVVIVHEKVCSYVYSYKNHDQAKLYC